MKKIYFFIFLLTSISVFLVNSAAAQAPVITSFSPATGGTGTSVTISGTNFSATAASNRIFFGATKAIITAATATQLTVNVPAGATCSPISVTTGVLTGYSRLSFNPTFASKNTLYASDFATPVSPGTIINAGTSASPRMALPGDFDGDGLVDLAIVSRVTPGSILIYLNSAATPGTFTLAGTLNTTLASPSYLAMGDLDGDGKLDIVVANGTATVGVFLNTSTGTGNANFTAVTNLTVGGTPNSVAIADIDGDGKPDIISSASTKLSVLRNTIVTQGTVSFDAVVNYTVGTKSYFTLAGDMDGDGKPDLVTIDVGVNPNVIYILQNKATVGVTLTSGSFGTPVSLTTTGTLTTNLSTLGLADMDGDGKLDIIATNYGNSSISIFRNTSAATGSFTFDPKVDFNSGASPGYVAIGDLDGDGKPDLAVSGGLTSKSITLFHNNFTSGSISSTSLSRNDIGTVVQNVMVPTIADLTGDNKPEIMIGAASGTSIYIFKNDPYQIPVISSISPLSGPVGTSVTITGTNFAATAANNLVYFGGTKATVTSASTTQLVVTVPAGAAFQPVTVINNSISGRTLSATSLAMFNTTFPAKNSTSEYDLEPRYDISTTTANSTHIVFADVDGDGLADMVVANRDKSMSVYLHNTSLTNYTNAYPANPSYKLAANTTIPGTPSFIATGDLDGDGKADIVVGTSSSTSQVFLTTGTNAGTANWVPTIVVGSSSPNALAIADIDGDGKLDIITTTTPNGSSNSFVCIFLNTSSGGVTSFGPNIPIPTLPQGTATVGGLAIGDIDGDGKPDIVLSNRSATVGGGLVYILRNVSQPGFVSVTADLSFVNPTVAANTTLTTPDNPYNIALADIDGDGKLDIAISTFGNAVSVFRNTSTTNAATGTSSFSFDSRVDYAIGTNGYAVGFGDFDGDGKPDMAVLNGASSPVISLFRNVSTNGATLSSTSFSGKVDYPLGSNITINAVFAIADIDGDGKADIVSPFPSSTVSMISILHNGGSYTPVITSFSPRTGQAGGSVTINGGNFAPIAANNVVYFGSVTATVTAASATQLTVTIPVGADNTPISVTNIATRAQSAFSTLFFNPVFTSKATITTGDFDAPSDITAGARSVLIADIDNDGKPDLVTIGAASIYNTHQKTASTGNLSATNFDTPVSRTATNTNMIMGVLGDIDGDGKLDVVGVGNGGSTTAAGTMYIYRNTSVSGTPSLATGIAFPTGINPSAVAVSDLDGDGRLDIITANFGDGTVSIYRNLSTSGTVTASSFALVRTINVGTNPTSVSAGDLDGDGKPDLVVTNSGSNNISILRNISTTASVDFSAAQSFATGINPQIATLADLDGDGKLDIIVPNNGIAGAGNTISVLRNTSTSGTINMDATIAPFTTGNAPVMVTIGDMNGDGKPDILVGNSTAKTISVLRNTSTGSGNIGFAANIDIAVSNAVTGLTVGDLDGDGKADIVSGSTSAFSLIRNDPASSPLVTTTTGNTTFTSSASTQTPVIIDGALTVTQANRTVLASATVTITGGLVNTEDVLAFTNDGATMGNITASAYDSTNGVLTLTSAGSTALLSEFQSALRSVTYSNSNTAPNLSNRIISFAANDGSQTGPSGTKIVALVSSNANIATLSVSSGTLSPTFDAATTTYTLALANSVSSITITPAAVVGASNIKVNGTTVASGSATAAISLATGSNTITIVVTGTDGTSTNTYTITATRAVSANADLSNLAISSGTLTPAFGAATTSYTASVANSVSSITITPTVADANSSIMVNGTTVVSGNASGSIALAVGDNTITTAITAQNGTTIKNYTVTVTRAPSANANLSALTISNGTLSPVFAASTNGYTASVANNITSLTVTPTLADATASITVNGTVVASGSASSGISLNVGSNSISVAVTAQDGTTVNTYTLSVTRAGSNNANLSNITLSSGTLTPTFASGTLTYGASVANNITLVTLTPTTSDANATVTVNGNAVTSGSASGSVSLGVGSNTITTIVTAQDGSTVLTYSVTVTRAASNDAGLSALALSSGTLSPAFATATASYTASVANSVTSLTVTPTTSQANAITTVNGTTVTSGNASAAIALNVGSNIITTIITAQDGSTQKTYTVTVTRAGSPNADLANLDIDNGTLTPTFNAATTSYVTGVTNTVSSVTITPTVAEPNATVKVNGTTVASGSGISINVNSGTNTITTVVTAQDGTTKTYAISAIKSSLSNNADLSSIVLNNGTLSPTFSAGTNSYTASVGNAVTSITLKPTVADATATIKVNGTTVASGNTSGSINLAVGTNTITTVVTAQDNITQNTYTVTVTRAQSSNADLTSLTLSNGTLSPAFVTATTTYTASVSNATTAITLTPTIADATATVTVNGNAVTSGSASGSIALSVGANTITTVVTAQDGTTKTYTITVTRAPSANANLSALVLNSGTLSPVFSSATNAYAASVSNATTVITLTPIVADATATIKVNSTTVSSGSASGSIALSVGTNTITTVVTAQDGTTINTYTVVVTRAQSSNANLSSITLSNGTLSPTFAASTNTYNTSVSNATTSITLTPVLADATATVKVNGTTVSSGSASGSITLAVGSNTINTVVTAQDGTINTYTVTVTRAQSSNNNLSNLAISSGTLSPTFTSVTTAYTATTSANSITLTPTVADATATLTVNGTAVTSGTASGNIALSVGDNTITTIVKAQDGTTKTYTITVTRLGIPQTLTFTALSPVTYGVADITPGATSTNSTLPITYSSSNTSVATIIGGKIHVVGAGSTTITASQSGDATYNAATPISQGLTVNTASLTVTAINQTKVYGAVNPTLTINYTGFVNNDTQANLTTQASTATTVTTTSGAGTYPITVSGAISANYTFTYTAGVFTVSPAALTITANSLSKSYGAANPTLTLSYSGFVGTDNNTKLTTQPTLSTTAVTNSPVSTYPITPAGATAANYAITFVPGVLTVTPVALAVSVANGSKLYGAALPAFTINYTGFISGDSQASLTSPATATTTATAASPTGTYPITVSGAVSANYTITYTAGVLTVGKAVLTIAANPATIVYGSAIPVFTPSYSGFVNGDTQAIITTAPTFTTTATGTSNAGAYPITATGAITSADYTISYSMATLTINKAPLTITANPQTRPYGAANPTLTASYSGFVNGDDATKLSTLPTITTTATITSIAGTYPITASAAAATNYTFTYVAGVLTVGQLNRTLTFNILPAKTYGDADFDPGASIDNGDAVIYTTSDATVATIVSGKIHIVGAGTVSITASAAANANYIAITPITQVLVINKASQVITFNPIGVQNKGLVINVNATSTSGLTVVLSSSDQLVATVYPVTQRLTLLNIGTTIITASQPGNNNYLPATEVVQTLQVQDPNNPDPVVVHSGISPNNDGVNDFLIIDGIKDYPVNKLTIVDRNGALLFEKANYDNASNVFDGHSTVNGSMVKQGTYFYVLQFTVNGESKKKVGYIILKY
jgi:gliding motility-associated-like protein